MKQNNISRKLVRLIILSLPIMVFFSAIYALTAANTVPESGLDFVTQPVTANQLKPADCSGLDLVNYITGGSGTTTNDLVLGTSGSDSLSGSDGNDCLVAGSGDDELDGGNGTDICIGGDGTDSFTNCETQIDP